MDNGLWFGRSSKGKNASKEVRRIQMSKYKLIAGWTKCES